MFRYSSKFKPSPVTAVSQQAIRSLVNDAHLITERDWAVSILRDKRNTGKKDHAYLILEGRKSDSDYFLLRSDLFLDQGNKNHFKNYAGYAGAALDYIFNASNSCHGRAFIRLKELNIEEVEALAEVSEYQSWGITSEEAEKLLKRLLHEGNKTYPYHAAGDSKSYSISTSQSGQHNCVSWCQDILQQELQIEKGKQWELVKKPNKVVRDLIERAKLDAASRPALNSDSAAASSAVPLPPAVVTQATIAVSPTVTAAVAAAAVATPITILTTVDEPALLEQTVPRLRQS